MITGDSYIGSNRQHRLSDQVSANTFQQYPPTADLRRQRRQCRPMALFCPSWRRSSFLTLWPAHRGVRQDRLTSGPPRASRVVLDPRRQRQRLDVRNDLARIPVQLVIVARRDEQFRPLRRSADPHHVRAASSRRPRPALAHHKGVAAPGGKRAGVGDAQKRRCLSTRCEHQTLHHHPRRWPGRVDQVDKGWKLNDVLQRLHCFYLRKLQLHLKRGREQAEIKEQVELRGLGVRIVKLDVLAHRRTAAWTV